MDPLDILYTPLDIPPTPPVDVGVLLEWIKTSKKNQIEKPLQGTQNAESTIPPEIYPWVITYARINHEWQCDFDKRFPILARFFYEGFGLTEDELARVVILPVKPKFVGRGFWHSDPDEVGLRVYLENQDIPNSLWIKPTTEKHNTRGHIHQRAESLVNSVHADKYLQDKTHVAEIVSPTQAFYLNNVRAVHAVNVNDPVAVRIACIVAVKGDVMTDKIRKLIVDSAAKYPQQAILWTPTNDDLV
jgi:hypothetical protein